MKKTTANYHKCSSEFFYELQKRDRYAAELFGDNDTETVVFDQYFGEWQIVDRHGNVLFATDNVNDIIDMYVDMVNEY